MELFSVMVTGANGGIGLEFVRQVAALNYPPKHIFATYTDERNLVELLTVQEAFQYITPIHVLKMVGTDVNEIQAVADYIYETVLDNGLTLLIHTSAIIDSHVFPRLTSDLLRRHFKANAASHLLVTQAVYPLLKLSAEKQDGDNMNFSRACILCVSAMMSSLANTGKSPMDPYCALYKISKAALSMGMKIIAENARKDNILVVTMCPGWVSSDLGLILKGRNTGISVIEPVESVSTMLFTLFQLDEGDNGYHMDRFGHRIAF